MEGVGSKRMSNNELAGCESERVLEYSGIQVRSVCSSGGLRNRDSIFNFQVKCAFRFEIGPPRG